jgi:CDP-diacylglycerol--serine O-phosphatidyltransferase
MKIRSNIPNLITLLNLACGSIAIIQVFSGEMVVAAWFIIIAAAFDFLDGFAARLLHSKSSIGAQLDSLADVVSFGLAPAMIMYQLIVESSLKETAILREIVILPYFSILMVMAGAYRLARFNTDPGQSDEFRGLPIPANGLFVAALPLMMHYPSISGVITDGVKVNYVLVSLVLFLSFLMVSRIRMISLKFHNLKWKENAYRFLLIAPAPVLLIFFGFTAIPMIIIYYIILSGIRNLVRG